jgi:2-polyprenyl-6-methoxyphenol hydroxylase-like FAD-dependent oxidoreductase
MTDSSSQDVDVLVVGGGPVGLVVAGLLGAAGIHTLLIERNPSTSHHPRASGVHPRTMELFRQWGIADDVRGVAVPPERSQGFGWMTRLNGQELGQLLFADPDQPPSVQPAPGPEDPCFCPQTEYEPILLAAAARHPSVTLEFDCEAIGLSQDEDHAQLTLRSRAKGRERRVRARYVIAADGASSPIRSWLGISESGTGRFGHSLNVHFRAGLSSYVQGKPFMLFWVVNGDTQGTIARASADDSRWTYNFDAEPDREYSSAEIIRQVRLAVGDPALQVEIVDVMRWDYEQSVADCWRSGRVLLAGDAAHRFPPHGAFGMNSGVQDAHNLAWKLAAVLRGTASPALLDTYEAERRPVALSNSRQALANTASVSETGWHGPSAEELAAIELPLEGADLRARIGAAVDAQRPHLHSLGQQFGAVYASTAVLPDGTAPEPSTISEYRESGHPGARAPHVWLRDRDGRRVSTLDLWRGEFTLLVGPGGASWLPVAEAVATSMRVPLTAHQVGPGLPLEEHDRPWTKVYGVSDDGAVLVRPDGHVAARFQDASASPDGLTAALRHVLHLDVPAAPADPEGERR